MRRSVVQVSAGVGPEEVRRFVALLAARLEARCEALGLGVEAVVAHGDERSPRSVELVVVGDAELLSDERGTHALVARSDARGRGARKRWFAGVTVFALEEEPLEEDAGSALDPKDLVITACRAGGPGGQHVNKASTAVRVAHAPSGLVVRVSDERSQRANVKRALARLAERLSAVREAQDDARVSERRLAHYRLTRGAPVREYRLSPRGDGITLKG